MFPHEVNQCRMNCDAKSQARVQCPQAVVPSANQPPFRCSIRAAIFRTVSWGLDFNVEGDGLSIRLFERSGNAFPAEFHTISFSNTTELRSPREVGQTFTAWYL